MSLRCGRIQYTNDLPIYAAFDVGAIEYPGTLHEDVPVNLNAMLLSGELDLSPVSAFAWAQHADELILLRDLCIGARDEVVSVVLVSTNPPEMLDGETIYVTQESASGRNLLRVLLERRYGVHPTYVVDAHALERAYHGAPTLLIGDLAIDAVSNLPAEYVYDLGSLWREWTGEQSVLAVWAARRDTYERSPEAIRTCMHALTDAYSWSRSHRAEVVALAQAKIPRAPGFYESYYGKLNYTLHYAAQSGLTAYCRELYAIGAIPAVPSSLPEAISVLVH